jgi:predicted anti-sigma-YlaC factor YlaD
MNPCPRYEESLILYSYQELGRKKVVTLQKHLSQCEKCRGYLDELNHVFQIIENRSGSSPDLFLDIQW